MFKVAFLFTVALHSFHASNKISVLGKYIQLTILSKSPQISVTICLYPFCLHIAYIKHVLQEYSTKCKISPHPLLHSSSTFQPNQNTSSDLFSPLFWTVIKISFQPTDRYLIPDSLACSKTVQSSSR